MSSIVNIESEWINSENLSLPIIHILIPGKQLCEQAKNYLQSWKSSGFLPEPTLGSLLIVLLFKQYNHSHRFLISYVEPSISLADINLVYQNSLIQLDKSYISFIKALKVTQSFTICSHFLPLQIIIKLLKRLRSQHEDQTHLIVELQHGWVVGKQSALRPPTAAQTNPDIYYTIDKKSKDYLKSKYKDVKILLAGDMLFAVQLLDEFGKNLNSIDSQFMTQKSLNLLICFSARDVELGYASSDIVHVGKHPFPKELVSLVNDLNQYTKKINIRIRAKPHQNQDKLPKGFNVITHQNSLASDVLWSDLVFSALSTVSVSTSLLGIPSCFYISNWLDSHQKLLSFYSQNILHIKSDGDINKLKNIIKRNHWIEGKSERIKFCLRYARTVQNQFYNITDKVLDSLSL